MTTSIGSAVFLYHDYRDIDYPWPCLEIDWITKTSNLPDFSWLKQEYDYGRPKSLSTRFEQYLQEAPWSFWVFAATAYYLTVVTDATRAEWAARKNAKDVMDYINANGALNRKKSTDHTSRMPAKGHKNVLPAEFSALYARMWNDMMGDNPSYSLPIRDRGPHKHKCPDCGTIFTRYEVVLARLGDENYMEVLLALKKQQAIDEAKRNE